MQAICKICGEQLHWRASRGTSLAALRCPCGGELRGITSKDVDQEQRDACHVRTEQRDAVRVGEGR